MATAAWTREEFLGIPGFDVVWYHPRRPGASPSSARAGRSLAFAVAFFGEQSDDAAGRARLYSTRIASMGSTLVACLAGISAARTETARRTRHAPTRGRGSVGSMP